MQNLAYITLSLLFLILAGFLAGIEISFVCTNPLKQKSSKNKLYTKYIAKFSSNPERIFTVILVGTNIFIILSSTFTTLWLIRLKVPNPSLAVSVFFTPIVLLLAEMFPKTIGRSFKDKFTQRFIGLFSLIDTVLKPITVIINQTASWLLKAIPKKAAFTWDKDNIKILADTLYSQGAIEESEKEAIKDILGFSDDKIKEVMRPIQKTIAVDYIDSRRKILNIAKKYGFTRYPVYRSGKICGYINIYDLFYNEKEDWHRFIRKITIVGISQKFIDVFSLLQKKRETIAIIKKGNKTAGFVSLYDIMEKTIESFAKGRN